MIVFRAYKCSMSGIESGIFFLFLLFNYKGILFSVMVGLLSLSMSMIYQYVSQLRCI